MSNVIEKRRQNEFSKNPGEMELTRVLSRRSLFLPGVGPFALFCDLKDPYGLEASVNSYECGLESYQKGLGSWRINGALAALLLRPVSESHCPCCRLSEGVPGTKQTIG